MSDVRRQFKRGSLYQLAAKSGDGLNGRPEPFRGWATLMIGENERKNHAEREGRIEDWRVMIDDF